MQNSNLVAFSIANPNNIYYIKAQTYRCILSIVASDDPYYCPALHNLTLLIYHRHVLAEINDFTDNIVPTNIIEQTAKLLRQILIHNPQYYPARLNLTKLIYNKMAKAVATDFPDNVIPHLQIEQSYKLFKYNLILNPNCITSQIILATTIEEIKIKTLLDDYIDNIVPPCSFKQSAILLRKAREMDPYNTFAIILLSKMIFKGFVKAKAPDYFDNIVPPTYREGGVKLLRYAVSINPNCDDIRYVLNIMRIMNLNAKRPKYSVKYHVTMALNPDLPEKTGFLSFFTYNAMHRLMKDNPNLFMQYLLSDTFLCAEQKRPYFKYLLNFNNALSREYQNILIFKSGYIAYLNKHPNNFFSRLPYDIVKQIENYTSNDAQSNLNPRSI